ncbi:MAG: hypothetical protein WHT08_01430 [Bryobacteraceae bacterium]
MEAARAATSGAAGILFFFDPAGTQAHPRCRIRHSAGRGQAKCRAARAMNALLSGRVKEPWRLNALRTAGTPALAGWGVWRMRRKRHGGEGA